MSKITLIHGSCANQNVDAVVNAANKYLMQGGGICGALFKKAGADELAKECAGYSTPLKDGEAVCTSACKMTNCKILIHAVGPDFNVNKHAFKELYEAYYNSLLRLKEKGLHSISFPLISSSIFGGDLPHPVQESTKQCLHAYRVFIREHPDYEVDVLLCAFTKAEYLQASVLFEEQA